MNIGIDIDGVLTNEHEYFVECLGKMSFENKDNNILENIDAYEEFAVKEPFRNTIRKEYQTKYFDEYVKNAKPRKFASEVTKLLKLQNHNIFLITSRHLSFLETKEGKKMRKNIKKWLSRHHICYDKLFCVPTKEHIIQALKLDVMIEDSPVRIPVYVKLTHVFCMDCSYNKHLKYKNMTRVFNWYDIYQQINSFAQVDSHKSNA